ncbi:MAG: phage tail protein [Pseudomonadota bacterium]
MPIEFDARLPIKQISKDLGSLAKPVMRRAVPHAFNRVLTTTRKESTKVIRERTKLKAREINQGSRLFKANPRRWEARLDLRNATASNLRRFVRDKFAGPGKDGEPQYFRRRAKTRRKPRRYLRRGVRARAWGVTKDYRGTFIARGRFGNLIVMKREGEGRNAKLVGVVGPSPRFLFEQPDVRAQLLAVVDKRMRVELPRSVQFYFRRLIGTN